MTHWRVFVRWIGKRALLAQLDVLAATAGPGMGERLAPPEVLAAGLSMDIPVLTRDKVMAALSEHRGSLHKTAHALGTSTHRVCLAQTEVRPGPGFPAGLTIIS